MNIFKLLKSKAGKMPVTFPQIAGIAVVGAAAGFGAMSFLSSSSDTNNAFLPPSGTQGQVVYVAQNAGGGQYEANGEVSSSLQVAPSRAIQLANKQAEREAQARALEESSHLSPVGVDGTSSVPTPQAYQLTGADLGQGLGGGKEKDLNMSLETFSSIQNQLTGVTQAMNNAQAGATTPGAPGSAAAGQAQLAGLANNLGKGSLTRAGGGSGSGSSANSFVIQDSGKNGQDSSTIVADAMAQVGDAMAQTRESMDQLQEGTRLQSRARFDRLTGFKGEKDGRIGRSRRFGSAKDELSFIRKQTALIAKNTTNSAVAGMDPFLANNKISGGLTVEGQQVTTGQNSSSKDLSNFSGAMKRVKGKMGNVQTDVDERDAARDDLKNWFWTTLTTALGGMVGIALLVKAAKAAPFPAKAILYALAGILTAATLAFIWVGAAKKIPHYVDICGADGWSRFGWAFASILTAGVGLSWVAGLKVTGKVTKFMTASMALVGFGGVGYGLADLFKKDDSSGNSDEEEGDDE